MFNKINSTIKKFSKNEFILRKCNGSFYINNIYRISNSKGLWHVYKHNNFISNFDSSSNATLWCYADILGFITEANNLIVIDHKLQDRKNDINIQKHFLHNNPNAENFDIVVSKIKTDIFRCKSIKKEINENFKKRLNTVKLLTGF